MPLLPSRREFLARSATFAAGFGVLGNLMRGAESPPAKRRASLDPAKLAEAERIIRGQIEARQLAAATLVVRAGAFEFARAFGSARLDTPFLVASITKPMTATAAMLLVERGALRLDDPVRKFIPKFSGGERERVTIRHLLTHTSGLPDMLPENNALRQRHAPLSEFVTRACETPLLFTPGTKVSYQSMGVLLLATIVETIGGKSLADILKAEVFLPLKLTGTSLGLGGRPLAQMAQCEVAEQNDWDWNSAYWRNLASPWGGAHATAGDVANFVAHFAGEAGGPLPAATRRDMRTRQTVGLNDAWGFGWSCDPRKFAAACGPATYGHSGSTGVLTWHDPDANVTFVLLTTKPAATSNRTLIMPVSEAVAGSVRT